MRESYRRAIKGKTILITGGTGSFGNTVVKVLLEMSPKRIIIFSRDEKKQFDMRNAFGDKRLEFIIGDTRELDILEKVFEGVDYVFHAAALKQVPTCEFFPMEAVKTNIIGTQNVLSVARKYKVKKVVVLSTDKSVYPINVMGLSKAMMEKLMISDARKITIGKQNTVFCGIRYGNVLYTRGSVVPYFVELIKKHKKLPVTNLDMTRFLLPLPDAVDLVLYALVNGKSGHIYVRKSPAATMKTLTEAICKIFNHTIGYFETGIRAGEKIHETLLSEEEYARAKETRNYFDIPPESQGLDYNKYFSSGRMTNPKEIHPYTSDNTYRLNLQQTITLLMQISDIKEELKNLKIK